MNFKKIFSAAAACAVAAFSMAAMSTSVSAAEIAYTGPSEGAISADNSGVLYRVNIYNTWGNSVTDINNAVTIEKNVAVTFTVSGLGSHTTNVDDAGNPTDAYYAQLMGAAGNNQYWGEGDTANTVENPKVDITGDGQYTAVFEMPEGTASIECLFLQTNINFYQLDVAEPTGPADCGMTITIDKVEADVDAASAGGTTDTGSTDTGSNTSGNTTATDANSGNASSGNSASSNSGSTSSGSTSSGSTSGGSTSSGGSSLGSSTKVTSASTGDNGVAPIAITGLIVTAAAAVATQIKRK